MVTAPETDISRIIAAAGEKTFSGAQAYLIVDQCRGCANVVEHEGNTYCRSYKDTKAKWMFGSCNLGSHVVRKVEEAKKINPLKASKKAMKGK